MAQPTVATRPLTAEEFYELCGDGRRTELIAGEEVVRAPAGYRHGRTGQRLSVRLGHFVEEHGLGVTLMAETGFVVAREPDTVLAPDVAFITAERTPPEDESGFADLAPDLTVEVVSPNDRPAEVLAKVGLWLEAGARVVWVVWPDCRQLQIWRGVTDHTLLGPDDTLTCDDLLPGFALKLSEVFGDDDG